MMERERYKEGSPQGQIEMREKLKRKESGEGRNGRKVGLKRERILRGEKLGVCKL